MISLKSETVAFLATLNKGAGMAGKWGSRTRLRGSRQRHPYMGRARLYANRRMSKARGWDDEKRDHRGRWTFNDALNHQDMRARLYAHLEYHTKSAEHKSELLRKLTPKNEAQRRFTGQRMADTLDRLGREVKTHQAKAEAIHSHLTEGNPTLGTLRRVLGITSTALMRLKKAYEEHDERGEPRDGRGRWTQSQKLTYAAKVAAEEASYHQQSALFGQDVAHHKELQAIHLQRAMSLYRAALVSYGTEGRNNPLHNRGLDLLGELLVRLRKGYIAKAGKSADEPRDRYGKWTVAQHEAQAKRHLTHAATLRSLGTGIRSPREERAVHRELQAAEMHTQMAQRKARSARSWAQAASNAIQGFSRLAAKIASKVKKDLEAGDVHLTSAVGGDTPRRKRKYPQLSLARLPNGQVNG